MFGLEGFKSSAERLKDERAERVALAKRRLSFGVPYLDDALAGILPHDLILVGARTGGGKTDLARIVAHATAKAGKRVHYFALEAEPNEIERRIKYTRVMQRFYRDAYNGQLRRMSYRGWHLVQLDDTLLRYEAEVDAEITAELQTLTTYYRGARFDLEDIGRLFLAIKDQTDLIILDHLHYVDSKDPNENRGYKEIMKAIRDASLAAGRPVIVIAHLRKSDRRYGGSMPDIDDFHGSSDITKVPTKVLVLQGAPATPRRCPHLAPTYMQVLKERMDGYRPWVGLLQYDSRLRSYHDRYGLGRFVESEWHELPEDEQPYWYRDHVEAAR